MKYIYICLSLFISNCGTDIYHYDFKRTNGKPRINGINEQIKPFYDQFSKKLQIKLGYIPAQFSKLDKDLAGICWEYNGGYVEIEIDSSYWEQASYSEKEQLIFHELGHCALRLDHNENILDLKEYGKIPESIMFPTVFGHRKYYETFKNYYYNQLKFSK